MGAQFPFGIDTHVPDNTNLAIRSQKAFQLNNIKALKVTKWREPICQSAGTKAPSVLGEFNISNRLVKQRSLPSTIKTEVQTSGKFAPEECNLQMLFKAVILTAVKNKQCEVSSSLR